MTSRAPLAGSRADRAADRLVRVGELLTGESADELAGPDVVAAARRAKQLVGFLDRLGEGDPVDLTLVRTVRTLVSAGDRTSAYRLIEGFADLVGPSVAAVARGHVLILEGRDAAAWRFFASAVDDDLVGLAPRQAVAAALADGSPAAVERALRLAEHRDLPAGERVEIAGRLLVTGHAELAWKLQATTVGEEEAMAERQRLQAATLSRWSDDRPAPPVRGAAIGILDYDQIDYVRTSRNVGDYVQTLALLGNLARFTGLRCHGESGLPALMTELQGRVRPALRLARPEADATLVPVSRDYSVGAPIPEDTWTIAFGWHLHSSFRLSFALPYHPAIRPIFCSFHLNLLDALSPEAIDYLRAHGPVGCRDWSTVDVLLSAGVDAFFSGCLTTTVDAVYPEAGAGDAEPAATPYVAAVDLTVRQRERIAERHEELTHITPDARDADLVAGVRAADALLERYRSEFTGVITSRLHCFLPASALGVDVTFKPRSHSDVRFDGLLGLRRQPARFDRIRDGIRELLAEVFALVLDGADPDTVYGRWRELTADRVAAARRRHVADSAIAADPVPDEPAAAVVTARRGPAPSGPAVVIAVDPGDVAQRLPTALRALRDHSGPFTAHLLVDSGGSGIADRVAADLPDLPLAVHDGTEAEVDLRLLLPDLLTEDRAVLLTPDVLVAGDITTLAGLDLGGRPVAARSEDELLATRWQQVAARPPAQRTYDLRRVMAHRHRFGITCFATSVLVLDLARLRADDLLTRHLPELVGRYGLGWADALHAYVGGDRAELPASWSVVAGVDVADSGDAVDHTWVGGAPRPHRPTPV